tara:strand:- start:14 stop:748 length:735 start_codon:yes stop_codon:yes gene_type:complete
MEFLLKNMSTSKGAEKLKITVTNIRSVLIRKNKRLANLKKINTRDTRKLFSLSKARDAENKLERKKVANKAMEPVRKVSSILKFDKVIDSAKLLVGGIAINAIFDNIDGITETVQRWNDKISKFLGNNQGKMDKVEKGLDGMDLSGFENITNDMNNMNSDTSDDTSDDEDKPILGGFTKEKDKALLGIPTFHDGGIVTGNKNKNVSSTSRVKPLVKDKNLSTLLSNSTIGSDTTIIVMNQPIEV